MSCFIARFAHFCTIGAIGANLVTMLYTSAHDIEDRVVEKLAEDRATIKTLAQSLGEEERVSLRGVYKAVDQLIASGVALKVGKKVILNHEWAQAAASKLAAPTAQLIGPQERISYTFTSLEHLDTFWKSTVLPLERTTGVRELFIYNPHSFWILLPGRKESEESFFNHFGPQQAGFLTIGGETAADWEFKRTYQHDYLQIDLRPLASIRRTDHVTVLGPYIITTRLSKSLVERMDALYAASMATEMLLPELMKLYARPGKMKIIIEHSSGKAEKLRRTLARNFYIKRPE